MSNKGSMNRLVQWVRQGASSLRSDAFLQSSRQTVRTIETVECQEHTLLIGSVRAGPLDICPMCGRKLVQEVEGQTLPQLHD